MAVAVETAISARIFAGAAVGDHPAAVAGGDIAVQLMVQIGKVGATIRDAESQGHEQAQERDHRARAELSACYPLTHKLC
jgi:hypothetical protein